MGCDVGCKERKEFAERTKRQTQKWKPRTLGIQAVTHPTTYSARQLIWSKRMGTQLLFSFYMGLVHGTSTLRNKRSGLCGMVRQGKEAKLIWFCNKNMEKICFYASLMQLIQIKKNNKSWLPILFDRV